MQNIDVVANVACSYTVNTYANTYEYVTIHHSPSSPAQPSSTFKLVTTLQNHWKDTETKARGLKKARFCGLARL